VSTARQREQISSRRPADRDKERLQVAERSLAKIRSPASSCRYVAKTLLKCVPLGVQVIVRLRLHDNSSTGALKVVSRSPFPVGSTPDLMR